MRGDVELAIERVEWPLGAGSFTLFDEPGKKRGRGNGVKPIKELFFDKLRNGWSREGTPELEDEEGPGPLDASFATPTGLFAVEWETGNVSSSHRAINKIALNLLAKSIAGGILILPTRKMSHYLTDRVGNWEELVPYLPLWRSLSVEHGILAIVAVEHDAVSTDVPRFPKATNGRAMG